MKGLQNGLTSLAIVGCIVLSAPADEWAIDRLHRFISQKVVSFSDEMDRTLADFLADGDDRNMTDRQQKRVVALWDERSRADRFFQTQKYLNETSATYIRVRFETAQHSRMSDENSWNVRVHLPLGRTKRRLRLFVQDLTEENARYLTRRDDRLDSDDPKFGIEYFAPARYGVASKYTLGMSGLHPYARARFSTIWENGRWMVEPVQEVGYSFQDDLSERTDLFVDTMVDDGLVRLEGYRGTRAHRPGMSYGAAVSYSRTFDRRSGVRVVQAFSGHTHYEYTLDGDEDSQIFSGIYSYTTAIGYRRSIWRPWFLVEVIPAVDFRKEYGYRPDYSIRLLADLFFGKGF
jgi:hypothetical protein